MKKKINKNLIDLFEEYISYCEYSRRLSRETIRSYEEMFRHFLNMMPEILTSNLLTKEKLNDFFKKIQTRKRIVGINTVKIGIKDSTIRAYWNRLNAFFGWLVDNGHIAANPLNGIKTKEPVYNDRRALNRDDISKIITAIELHSFNVLIKKRDMLIINILIFCGLRKNELVLLEIRDVNLENRTITIRGETSKSKKTRTMPINKIVFMSLKEYFAERKNYKTPYLFVSSTQDKGLTHHGIKHLVKRLFKVSGIKFHLHRFRHTFASSLGKQGISAIKLQKLLGHSDLRMTDRYVRSIGVEELRDDVEKMNIDNLI